MSPTKTAVCHALGTIAAWFAIAVWLPIFAILGFIGIEFTETTMREIAMNFLKFTAYVLLLASVGGFGGMTGVWVATLLGMIYG